MSFWILQHSIKWIFFCRKNLNESQMRTKTYRSRSQVLNINLKRFSINKNMTVNLASSQPRIQLFIEKDKVSFFHKLLSLCFNSRTIIPSCVTSERGNFICSIAPWHLYRCSNIYITICLLSNIVFPYTLTGTGC